MNDFRLVVDLFGWTQPNGSTTNPKSIIPTTYIHVCPVDFVPNFCQREIYDSRILVHLRPNMTTYHQTSVLTLFNSCTLVWSAKITNLNEYIDLFFKYEK